MLKLKENNLLVMEDVLPVGALVGASSYGPLCEQLNYDIKINQHIYRDTKNWLHGSALPMSAGLSQNKKDFNIYQLGYSLSYMRQDSPFL